MFEFFSRGLAKEPSVVVEKEVAVTVFSLPGSFKIPVPLGWEKDIVQDYALCRLFHRDRLSSGILIGAVEVSWSDSESLDPLLEATRKFIDGCKLDWDQKFDAATQTIVDGENNVADTWIMRADDTGWLIRLVYSAPKGVLYYLHCNGPLDELREISPFFDLFEVLPDESDQP